MPTLTPDQPTTDPTPAPVSAPAVPPAPRRAWLDPTTLRGQLPIATWGPLAAAILFDLPHHLSIHWH